MSALDPARDAVRWQRLVSSVVARAWRPPSVSRQLSRWARPVLCAAALLALLGGVGLWRRATPVTETSSLARWMDDGELPSTTTLLEMAGDDDGQGS